MTSENLDHLPITGKPREASIDYSSNPITDAVIPPLDRSGPEEVRDEKIKKRRKKERKKDKKKKAFKNGLLLISLSEEKRFQMG